VQAAEGHWVPIRAVMGKVTNKLSYMCPVQGCTEMRTSRQNVRKHLAMDHVEWAHLPVWCSGCQKTSSWPCGCKGFQHAVTMKADTELEAELEAVAVAVAVAEPMPMPMPMLEPETDLLQAVAMAMPMPMPSPTLVRYKVGDCIPRASRGQGRICPLCGADCGSAVKKHTHLIRAHGYVPAGGLATPTLP
jgi:hypothetical protein